MRILLLVWRGWLLVASWVLVVVCVRFLGVLGGEIMEKEDNHGLALGYLLGA